MFIVIVAAACVGTSSLKHKNSQIVINRNMLCQIHLLNQTKEPVLTQTDSLRLDLCPMVKHFV